MKLRKHQFSIQPQIFSGGYEHPWYKFLNKPNPPTQEAVDKAQFIDKTYHWDMTSDNRPRNRRTTK